MREVMNERTGGGPSRTELTHKARASGRGAGARRLPTTGLGRSIAALVAACYAVVTFSGCALNREYQVSANGVPLSAVYADAAQTTTDATPNQEEKGWWARNWPYVLLAIVVLGGIAAGVALSQGDDDHKQGPGFIGQ